MREYSTTLTKEKILHELEEVIALKRTKEAPIEWRTIRIANLNKLYIELGFKLGYVTYNLDIEDYKVITKYNLKTFSFILDIITAIIIICTSIFTVFLIDISLNSLLVLCFIWLLLYSMCFIPIFVLKYALANKILDNAFKVIQLNYKSRK